MKRRETHKRWKCPKCGNKFTNPIGLTAVACSRPYHGTRKEPVAMQPIEEVPAND